MSVDKVKLLCEISDKILEAAGDCDKLTAAMQQYADMEEISEDGDIKHILENMKHLLLNDSANNKEILNLAGQRVVNLSEEEKAELDEFNRIIDNNLFEYHFQPIVSTKDGSIYSFEALMRPQSDICKSPVHILKYAEITGRLADIEKATFINILKLVDANGGMVGDRHIFINSIPKVSLNKSDFAAILPLLNKYSDSVVIEMTEQSEMTEEDLESIRKIYEGMGIRLAIDDYGTGYSNVQNLIRYTPDYVKIDRSLICGVSKDHRKQHFVREIIDFCHDNGIMALAEGVETREELHTVISLGVDLIQGYYTAKPCAKLIDSVPSEIRDEIKRCREEHDRDKSIGIYRANSIDKIRLERFDDDEYSCIVLTGSQDATDCNVILTGYPKHSVHVVIEDGFNGKLILDSAELTSAVNKPCITVGEDCNVQLVLKGSNRLHNGGIKVPETSCLTVSGEGVLRIRVDGDDFFGIGNDRDSRHGKLVFEQGVTITNDSAYGVGIGSGLGGDIEIKSGKFEINMRGVTGVALGSFKGNTNTDINSCDVQIDCTLQKGVGIGSLEGDTKLHIKHSSVKIKASGNEIVGIGTFKGDTSSVDIEEASTLVDIGSDDCAAVAAVKGKTTLSMTKASLHIFTKGIKTYAVGYLYAPACIDLKNAELKANIVTNPKFIHTLRDGSLHTAGGRVGITVNGEEFYSRDY